MAKKAMATLLAAATCVSLLAGCGSTDTNTASEAAAGQTAESSAGTESGDSEGLIPITFCRTQNSSEETDIFPRWRGQPMKTTCGRS